MLSCIGSLLGAQSKTDGGFWAQPRAQQLLAALLNFAVDERPKVRKAAQAAIGSLLREHRMAGSNAISKIVGQYCHTAIVNASQLKNDKASMQVLMLRADGNMLHCVRGPHTHNPLQLLAFLRSCLPLLPASTANSLCKGILKLSTLGRVSAPLPDGGGV